MFPAGIPKVVHFFDTLLPNIVASVYRSRKEQDYYITSDLHHWTPSISVQYIQQRVVSLWICQKSEMALQFLLCYLGGQ